MPRKLAYLIAGLSLILAAAAQNEKPLTEEAFQFEGIKQRMEYNDLADALKDPGSVTSLRLNDRELTAVPADIAKLTNLVELDLSGNNISDIGAALSGLTKLEKLDLSQNKFTKVPSLCQLKNLKVLNLGSNRIAGGDMSCMTSLQWVYLNNNSLTAVPDGLTRITGLRSVYLYGNQLKTLPAEFASMPNLESLLVQFNQIAEEPNAFRSSGIINYIFEPQLVSTRHLYKYLTEGPAYYVGASVENTLSKGDLYTALAAQSAQPLRPFVPAWERMQKYFGIRTGFGFAVEGWPILPFQLEYGSNRSAIGLYAGLDLDIGELTSAGISYKRFFTSHTSRFRPYVQVGFGYAEDDALDLDFDIMAKLGTDIYLLPWVGFNLEAGIGHSAIASAGWVFRFGGRAPDGYQYQPMSSPVGVPGGLDVAEQAPEPDRWKRMGKFVSVRPGFGWATHRYLRNSESASIIASIFVSNEIEFGNQTSGFGFFNSYQEHYVEDPANPVIDAHVQTSSFNFYVSKYGFFYRHYFSPLSSRLRPYVKGAVQINRETNVPDQYKSRLLGLQARAGVDFYLLRFLGLNVETGFGAGNFISGGAILRVPRKK